MNQTTVKTLEKYKTGKDTQLRETAKDSRRQIVDIGYFSMVRDTVSEWQKGVRV